MFQQHHYIFLHLLNQIRPANRLIGSKFPSFRDILRQKMAELDAGWTAQKKPVGGSPMNGFLDQ